MLVISKHPAVQWKRNAQYVATATTLVIPALAMPWSNSVLANDVLVTGDILPICKMEEGPLATAGRQASNSQEACFRGSV